MNFKTLFAVFSVALLGRVSAAPVETDVDAIKKACRSQKGVPLVQWTNDSVTYACLNVYNPKSENNKITPENASCYYAGEQILCVNDQYSNVDRCNKSDNLYSYSACSSIVSALNTDKSHLAFELKTYPDKDRIVFAPFKEQEDCEKNKGLVLTYKSAYQYLCLAPVQSRDDLKKHHCVVVDNKSVYCVDAYKSIFNYCDKESANYDKKTCNTTLAEYSKVKGIAVAEI